jgi:endonuclease/exonuclease/phosphatase family metal-dependent hydrolase
VRQPEQAAVVVDHGADLICLQEVTPTTLGPWRAALDKAALSVVRSSLDDWLPASRRRTAGGSA